MDTLPLPSRPDLAQYVKRAEDLVNSAQSENTSALKEFCNDWFDEIVRLSGPDLTDFVRGSYERAIGEVEKAAREASTKEGEDGPGLRLPTRNFSLRGPTVSRVGTRLPPMSTWPRARLPKGLSSRSRPMRWSTGPPETRDAPAPKSGVGARPLQSRIHQGDTAVLPRRQRRGRLSAAVARQCAGDRAVSAGRRRRGGCHVRAR